MKPATVWSGEALTNALAELMEGKAGRLKLFAITTEYLKDPDSTSAVAAVMVADKEGNVSSIAYKKGHVSKEEAKKLVEDWITTLLSTIGQEDLTGNVQIEIRE